MISVQWSVFNLQCSVSTVQCSVNSVQWSVFSVQGSEINVQCSVISVQCSMFSTHCSVFNVQLSVFSVQCSVSSDQCSLNSIQWSVFSVQWAMCHWGQSLSLLVHGRTEDRMWNKVFIAVLPSAPLGHIAVRFSLMGTDQRLSLRYPALGRIISDNILQKGRLSGSQALKITQWQDFVLKIRYYIDYE